MARCGGAKVNAIYMVFETAGSPAPSRPRSTKPCYEWHRDLTNHSVALLKHQRGKFDRDWLALDGRIAEASKDLYQYCWLIVNTRCFYWTNFKRAKEAARKGKTLARDDCMALCPFADYLNHADEGVSTQYVDLLPMFDIWY